MTERLPKPEVQAGSTIDRIHREGRLRIGVCPDAVGFSAIDPRTGRYNGLDIAFARKVAQAVFGGTVFGVNQLVQFVPISMGWREHAINEDEVDIVVSTYAPSPDRRKRVDFTTPYYGTSLTPITRADDPIFHVEDMRDVPLAVVENTLGADFVKKHDLGCKVFEVESVTEMVDTVRDGMAVAGLSATPILDEFARRSQGELLRSPLVLQSIAFSVGLRRNDDAFREFLSHRVNRLVEDGFVALAEACRAQAR